MAGYGYRLKIEKGSSIYWLPITFTIENNDWHVRENKVSYAFSHGGTDISDQKIEGRIITLRGFVYVTNNNRADFLAVLDEFQRNLYQRDYKLYLDLYYLNITKCISVNIDYIKGQNYNQTEVKAELYAGDPFWYHSVPDIINYTSVSDNSIGTIENGGSVEAYPIIYITANQVLPFLQIQNTSDVPEGANEGLKFTFISNSFQTGNTLVVDCQEGTVKIGETNNIRYFSGAFLKLLSGFNNLKFSLSPGCTVNVQIKFTKRRL